MAIHIGYKIPKNWKVIIWAIDTSIQILKILRILPRQMECKFQNCKLHEKAEYYAWLIITTIFLT